MADFRQGHQFFPSFQTFLVYVPKMFSSIETQFHYVFFEGECSNSSWRHVRIGWFWFALLRVNLHLNLVGLLDFRARFGLIATALAWLERPLTTLWPEPWPE
jgi:hypothetical protein